MPIIIERHNILLSCPGDVHRLIPVVERTLHDFNESYTETQYLELYLKHWSRDMYPKSGGKPQDLINRDLIPNCDAAIAVFWCRYGTPEDKYRTGTVEEIEEMIRSGRQVFLYFSEESPSYEMARKGIDPRIAEFKERYKNQGIYWSFKNEDEFSRMLSKHLRLHYIDKENAGYKAPESIEDRRFLAGLTQDECYWLTKAMEVDSVQMSLLLHYERTAVNSLVKKGLLSLEKEQKGFLSADYAYVLTPEGMRLAALYGSLIERLAHDPNLELRNALFGGSGSVD